MYNILDRVKLPFQKNTQFRKAIYNIIGFYPHNLELYREAFSHKSLKRSSQKGERPLNNERLEFLGDAVLEATVSDIIYHHFKTKREGFLTNTRSKLVSRDTLGRLAKDMGVIDLLQSVAHSNSHNSYVGGNAFEALVGAIYLDRGYKAAYDFVKKQMLGRMLDIDSTAKKEVNFKSKILEWSQKNRMLCEFLSEEKTRKDNETPEFFTRLTVEGVTVGTGKGYSKKQAEQQAAKDALIMMRRDAALYDSVFHAKENRTALEAQEFAALPRVEEGNTEISAATAPAGEHGDKRKKQNSRRRPRKTEKKTEETTGRRRPAPKKTPEE